MKKFDLALSLVAVAHHEAEAHKAEMKKNPGWYSGHKNKAKRAIMLARDLLMEASKELDDPCTK